MGLFDNYTRVNEEQLCPKCGRPDWCLIRNDGRACICTREKSSITKGDAGWLHSLPPGEVEPITASSKPKVYLTNKQVQYFLNSISIDQGEQDTTAMLRRQAELLGVCTESLEYMRVLYDSEKAALVFPMFDMNRLPCGARFRRSDGRKWSLKGGREGVFVCHGFNPALPVIVTEGPTDAAAAHTIGFRNILGRPNCSGGGAIIQEYVVGNMSTPVIILADPGEPGIDGAERLASQLRNPAIVLVTETDVREYVATQQLRQLSTRGILEGMERDCEPGWHTIYRNQTGQFQDFTRHFTLRQAA